MGEEERQSQIELERQAAIQREFGSPLDAFVGNVSEKAGGLLSSIGYATDSPRISQMGNSARAYGETLKPKGRDYTPYEAFAEYMGQAGPGAALAYATKSPFVAGAVDATSEIGTIINELQNQGYSDEYINRVLPDIIREEGFSSVASGLLGKLALTPLHKGAVRNRIPMRVTGGSKGSVMPESILRGSFGGMAVASDQPAQNDIYNKYTGR